MSSVPSFTIRHSRFAIHDSRFTIRARCSVAKRLAQQLVCALVAVVLGSATLVLAQGTPKSYTPPRTPWGDPDLQGKWPGTYLVGTPLQRDQKYGTRNTLTEAEFLERKGQFER